MSYIIWGSKFAFIFIFLYVFIFFRILVKLHNYVVTRKCMQLSLSNGCHSLSSCLTSDLLLSFLQYSNNLLFTSEIKSSFEFVLFHEQGGCPHCFCVLFFPLTFRKDQIYMCVNTTQGVCVQSAVQCNRYICSRKNRFHLTLLIQSTYPEEGHLTH